MDEEFTVQMTLIFVLIFCGNISPRKKKKWLEKVNPANSHEFSGLTFIEHPENRALLSNLYAMIRKKIKPPMQLLLFLSLRNCILAQCPARFAHRLQEMVLSH